MRQIMKNKLNDISRTGLPIILAILALISIQGPSSNTRAATAEDPEIPVKFALLVGITNYKNKDVNRIDGCENNVPLLKETLVKGYGFEGKNVVELTDKAAGKDEIINRFRSHLIGNALKVREAGKEALIVYYFCGHGSQYPDQDNEEGDKLDETFMAYDSRTDQIFDILDDEIDDLKAELRLHTTNAVFILESCHSGTGTRGNDYVAEETSPDTRPRPPYARRYPRTGEEDVSTYTELAASLSSRSALSERKETCNCEKPLSLMTKALIQGLNRATDKTTYRGLMREVATSVASVSGQEPQVEGNRDAILFGGAAKRVKPSIEIVKVLTDDHIVIKAGKIHGLRIGSQVSIYSSVTNNGRESWIVNGLISKVGDFYSEVAVPSPDKNPKVREINTNSYVVLTSPVFGGGPMTLILDARGKPGECKDGDNDLYCEIEKSLKGEGLIESGLVRLVTAEKFVRKRDEDLRGIIRLKRGKFADVFPRLNDTNPPVRYCEGNRLVERAFPPPNALVYYLDEGDVGGKPLFGLFFNSDDAQDLASRIYQAVRNYTLQMSLRSIDNAASPLPSNLKVSWRRVEGTLTEVCVDGDRKPSFQSTGSSELKEVKIRPGEFYQISIKNISGEIRRRANELASGEPYCITLLFLKGNGEIEVVYPKLNNTDYLADGRELDMLKTILFRATYPTGVENVIIIISRPQNNKCPEYSFYQTRGMRSPQTILDKVLTQSGVRSRDSGTYITEQPDQWGVINITVNIIEPEQQSRSGVREKE